MKKELLFSLTKKDFVVQSYKDKGHGGQKKNKREIAIRIIHRETGIMSTCGDERSQKQNKEKAFKNLFNKPEFQKWFRIEKAKRLIGKQIIEEQINKWVEEQMQEKYLKIEEI